MRFIAFARRLRSALISVARRTPSAFMRVERLFAFRDRYPTRSAYGFQFESLEDRCMPAAFTAGDVVAYRVGTTAAPLSAGGNPVSLVEFSPTGTLVQAIALPSSGGPL